MTTNVSDSAAYSDTGQASVQLLFSNGSSLRADYWRIVKDGRAGVSSFDHGQKYGLSVSIDAVHQLGKELQRKRVTDALLDTRTGDLYLGFEEDVEFRVFNFTGYEVWEIHFPDGTSEYSPCAK